MNYKIDYNNQKPIYLQLYEQVRRDIIDGVYPYKSKLPSKRVVESELGISTVTIEHAYGLLQEEGYIESRERSGYIVIFRSVDGFLHPVDSVREIKVKRTNRESFPFSVLTKAMRKVINDYGENILKKSENIGIEELRLAISGYLARSRGIHVSPTRIVVGSGAEYLYGMIVSLLGNELVYGIESPSYEKIEKVYEANHVKIDRLRLGNDGIESSQLKSTKAKVLHISPYRSFPTGITASASKRHEYIRWASIDKYIVEDDFESEFSVSTKPEETLFSLSKFDNVIYMNTFSRTISPSIRVGYMVLPEKLVSIFHKKLGIYSCTVPTFEQLLLAELLSSGDFERHINRERRRMRKELQNR